MDNMDDWQTFDTPLGTPPRRFSVPPGEPAHFLTPPHVLTPPWEPTPPLAVIESAKGKMKAPRHKKGDEKQAPGKESWVHGTKLVFFEQRKGEYLQAAEKKSSGDKAAPGIFYTKMAKLYLVKYGYNLGDDEDITVDVADPPDEAADMVINEKATSETDTCPQY
jgi:hypothetical protein